MRCAFCGEGDRWIKTCLVPDGSGLRVCDPCLEVLGSWLVVVSGDEVLTAPLFKVPRVTRTSHCSASPAY